MPISDLEFELPRRSILFRPDTELEGGGVLGYNADPNLIVTPSTAGETLLYNAPTGTRFAQTNTSPYDTHWMKIEGIAGGVWIQISSTAAQLEQVPANCLSGDAVGDVVYITGAISLGRYQVSKVDPSDYSKMPAVGMIISKDTATECTVQFRGRIDSIYTGLTPGDILFAGSSGALVSSPPTPGPSNMFIQKVGVALSTTVVGLEPDLTLTRRRA